MVAGIVVFLFFPGSFAEKSNRVLHGLCAQNHSHSHTFDGEVLPLDARCVGIYVGVIFTLIILGIRGRLFAMNLPQPRFLVVLTGFGALMAADGINSLFSDLGWWHLWESSDVSRVVTGYGMGIAMAVALVWLVAGTVFKLGDKQSTVQHWSDILWFVAPIPIILIVLEIDLAWLHVPISILLMVSAWLVLATLAFVTILLATRKDEHIGRLGQLHIPGVIGLVVGVVIMLALSFGRSWMENALGIPARV